MKKLFKKVLPIFMAVTMLIGNISPAFATVDTTQTINTSSNSQTEVIYNQESTFGVVIPKSIDLGIDKLTNYTVEVFGDISSDEKVVVIPDENFLLKDISSTTSSKDDVEATVSQNKTEWKFFEFETIGEGNVSAPDLSAGSWKGSFYFNISLEELNEDSIIQLSVGDELAIGSGDSYQVNAYYEGEIVNDMLLWESNNDNITADNGLIETKASAQVGDTATVDVSMPISTFSLTPEKEVLASFSVTIIDMVYTNDGEIITSLNIQPGESKEVEVSIIPASASGTVFWTTTAPAGLNLIKNGNSVTIKAASDMPMGNSYLLIASYGNYSKILQVNIAGEDTHVHAYNSNIVTEATCTTDGLKTYLCECGDTYDEVIYATGHMYNDWTTSLNPTCTTIGAQNRICNICGNIEEKDLEELGHDWDEDFTIDIEASCMNDGQKSIHCSRCDAVKDVEAIPMSGHNEIYGGTKDIHSKCEYCEEVFSSEHTMTEEIITEPTCLTKGLIKYSCICGYNYTEESEMLGHSIVDGICERCNKKIDGPGLYDAEGNILCVWEESGIDETCSNAASIINNNYPTTTKVIIQKGTESIANRAFYGCTKLTTIELSDSVISIGDEAFMSCSALVSIKLNDGLTTIGKRVFANCQKLIHIYIPSSVTTITTSSNTNSPFYSCSENLVIYCEASAKPSEWGSFWNTYKVNNNYPIGLKVDWDVLRNDYNNVVNHNKAITTWTIPEGVTEIPDYAFWNCPNLTEVIIPSSVKSIGNYAFAGCTALSNIDIPESVISIGTYAFSGCTALTNVKLPNSVTSLGSYAFNNCTGLTTIVLSENMSSINERTFYGCSKLLGINIPDNVTSIGTYAFGSCSSLANINWSENLQTIGNSAFRYCKKLISIELPGSVVAIGDYAFQGCTGLTSVTLNDGLTTIGTNAFQGCTGLIHIYIPSSVTTITTSSNTNSPFYSCSENLVIYCEASAKPSGWGNFWNTYKVNNNYPISLKVNWGISRSDYESIINSN